MKCPSTSPLAPSPTGEDTSLLSKARRDLSGASGLKDERVGHYLARWALSCPLAQQQFNNTVQHANNATSIQTTGEACKAAVEAYTASLLLPTAMCELVVNLRAPESSWRHRKLEYHRTVPRGPYSRRICTEPDFQARWKDLVVPVQLDDTRPPGSHGPSPHGSSTSTPGRVWWGQSIVSLPLTFIFRGGAYPVAGGNWTRLTISLDNFDRLACSPAGLWVLSMANCDDKAMDTLGTLWKSNWEVLLI